MSIEYGTFFIISRISFYKIMQIFLYKKWFFSWFFQDFCFYERLRELFLENSDNREGVPQANALRRAESLRARRRAREMALLKFRSKAKPGLN